MNSSSWLKFYGATNLLTFGNRSVTLLPKFRIPSSNITRASVWVPADVNFVALFSRNHRFLKEIVACISKMVLPRSVTGI